MRVNLRPIIEGQGFKIDNKTRTLDSISARHIWNVERGKAHITVQKLQDIANEIGVDMLDFFDKNADW